ncbi:MAG: outer membrane protein assembly factor BamD [Thermodesulfobacteriota bacterium]
MKQRLSCAALMIMVACAVAGCPSIWQTKAPTTQETAQDLYQKAEDLFTKASYKEAVEVYERLKSGHPEFEKIPEVYLKIADAYYKDHNFENAAARYFQFLELYPKHRESDRARYMIGMSFFDQIKRLDLDDGMVKRAEGQFKKVMEQAESEQWKKKAEEKYQECRKRLAEKELYKANVMWSKSNYKAARLAAQRVLDEFPNVGLEKEAKAIIEKAKGR